MKATRFDTKKKLTRYVKWVVVGYYEGTDGKWHEKRMVAPKGKKFKVTTYPRAYKTAERVNDSVWKRTTPSELREQERLTALAVELKREQEEALLGTEEGDE